MQKIKLSIIINHHRTPNILKMCLDALKENLKTIEYEIIVTDSATQENTIAMLKEHHPAVLFIGNPENVGFARVVNPAIQKACGNYLFSINADIIVHDEKSIADMMAYLEKNQEVGIIGPKLLNIDGSLQHSYFHRYTPLAILARRTKFGKTAWGKRALAYLTYQNSDATKPMEVDWLMGSALMTVRDRFEKAGPWFDERFFMYFEDADLCRRFEKVGLKVVYYPCAVFTHYHIRQSHGGRGLKDIFTNWLTRVHIASYLKYLWKWNVEMYFTRAYTKKRK